MEYSGVKFLRARNSQNGSKALARQGQNRRTFRLSPENTTGLTGVCGCNTAESRPQRMTGTPSYGGVSGSGCRTRSHGKREHRNSK